MISGVMFIFLNILNYTKMSGKQLLWRLEMREGRRRGRRDGGNGEEGINFDRKGKGGRKEAREEWEGERNRETEGGDKRGRIER